MPRFLPIQATPARGSTRHQAKQQQRGEEEQQQQVEEQLQQQEAQQQQLEAEQRQRNQLFEGVWAGKKF